MGGGIGLLAGGGGGRSQDARSSGGCCNFLLYRDRAVILGTGPLSRGRDRGSCRPLETCVRQRRAVQEDDPQHCNL